MIGTYEVAQAFRVRLTAAAPGAAVPAASVAWENKAFNVPAGRYYRAFFLPGIPRAVGLSDVAENRHVGIFQIDIMEPLNAGDIQVHAEAERIAACYKRGTVLLFGGVYVRCQKSYTVRPAQDDEKRYRMIVRVEWVADVSN